MDSKSSVITGAIRKARKICSSRDLFNHEIKKLKHILISGDYANSEFDNAFKTFLLDIHSSLIIRLKISIKTTWLLRTKCIKKIKM